MYRATVSFPTSFDQPDRIHKAWIRQAPYEHEFAEISFREWGIDISRIKPGTPIKLTIHKKKFVGYVHDINADMTATTNFTTVKAIGASYVMKQPGQAIYKNITASDVVKKIAIKYGFSYNIEPHPRVYPQISQAGLTDWQLMVRLAKQNGYFLIVDGTTINFKPLLQDFNDNIEEAKYFARGEVGFKNQDLLYSFYPVIGETLSHSGADKSAVAVSGIDPVTGEIIKVVKQTRSTPTRQNSQTELFDKYATSTVASTYDTAKYEAEAADENSKFPYRADLETMCEGSLRPGMPVYVDNVGSQYSGYWTVLESIHEVTETSLNIMQYVSRFKLGTDSLGRVNKSGVSEKPNKNENRRLIPNVRQTRIVPNDRLKSPSVRLKPTGDIRLVTSKNRTAPNKKFYEVSQNTWSSDQGNLKTKTPEKRRSALASVKVKNHVSRF